MRILLAEDDEITREILGAQLRRLGHTIGLAEDGAIGWELFQREQPHLIITDWMMPVMDGPELCRRVRAHVSAEYTYLIILTALDRKVGYLEGMRAGADDFVTKPADIAELKVRLRVAERILRLQTEVKQLEGLLPICPRCKRIQNEGQRWEPVENYISKRSDAQFSHGICPECYTKIIKPQLEALKHRQNDVKVGH